LASVVNNITDIEHQVGARTLYLLRYFGVSPMVSAAVSVDNEAKTVFTERTWVGRSRESLFFTLTLERNQSVFVLIAGGQLGQVGSIHPSGEPDRFF